MPWLDDKIPAEKKFLTVDDLVRIGYAKRTTIYRRRKHEGLPYIQDGKRVLIPRDEFEAWCEERRKNRRGTGKNSKMLD